MTDRRRRFLPAVSGRFLAVALVLLGVAVATYQTQQTVGAIVHDRDALKAQISRLQRQVDALQASNARKDAEIKRLTTLLVARGIDPRPTPIPTASRTRAQRPSQAPPKSSATPPSPKPSVRPSATHSPGPSAFPSPSPTCVLPPVPLLGCPVR